MVPPERVAGFAAAAFLLIVVPGPSVLFAISRGVALGRRAALATVMGNTAGAFTQAVLVAVGLGAIVARSILVFNAIKLIGAGYLLYLGVQALRHRRDHQTNSGAGLESRSMLRLVRDGYVVGLFNPKAIVFFTAILPQFAEPAHGNVVVQMVLLGLVFALIAMVSDSAWGVAAGTAREWLGRSPRVLETLRGFGGLVMIGLGARLLFTGRKD